jgi:hypothetical protein
LISGSIAASAASKSRHVAIALAGHGDFDRTAFALFGLGAELVIDRGEETDAVSQVRIRVEDHPDRMPEALRDDDPVGIDGPAVARRLPPANRVAEPRIVEAVAEDPVIDHRLQRVEDRRRVAKIRIRHTHGDPVLGAHATDLFQHVPLVAMGAAAIEKFVETCHGQPLCSTSEPNASRGDRKGGLTPMRHGGDSARLAARGPGR